MKLNIQTGGGVSGPFWRSFEVIWPMKQRPCLTFPAWVRIGWLGCTLEFIQWPFDGSSWPCGKLGCEVAWWTLGRALHGNGLEKITTMVWGTWESNPGPSVYQVYPLPSGFKVQYEGCRMRSMVHSVNYPTRRRKKSNKAFVSWAKLLQKTS